jgi:hypothetical protein
LTIESNGYRLQSNMVGLEAAAEAGAVQLPLRAEGVQEVYVFHTGTYPIYPKDGYPGAPTSDFEAVRIELG